MQLYNYKATVEKIVDGDTVTLRIDLGFTVSWRSNCRLAGINTPELTSKDPVTRAKALEAKQYLIDRFVLDADILIVSKHLDKYGRPVVDVYYGDNFENHLNQELIDSGLAVVY